MIQQGRPFSFGPKFVLNKHSRETSLKIFLQLYKQFLRCHLEFAIPAWAPWTAVDMEIMEKVQKRAINMIASLKSRTYEEKLRELGMTTLHERRVKYDLVQTYTRSSWGLIKLTIQHLVQSGRPNLAHANQKYQLRQEYSIIQTKNRKKKKLLFEPSCKNLECTTYRTEGSCRNLNVFKQKLNELILTQQKHL